MSSRILLAALALSAAASAQAAVSVDSTSFTYSQSFDTLASSGSANAWGNDTTLTGWYLYNKNNAAITSYGTAASATGGFFAFGAGSDRALGGTGSGGTVFGSPASGAVAGYIALALTNNTAATLSGFTFSYDGEQWRDGGVTAGTSGGSLAQTMKVEYGFGSSFSAVSSWTALGSSFQFTSPVFGSTSTSGVAVNGNGAGLVTGLGGSVLATWAPGDTLWVRWVETNDVNNDHSLAIDNVSFSVTAAAVPEPTSYALLLAGLGAVGFISRRRRG